MAKVKYLGDPSGDEHRHSIEHVGVKLSRGEWAELPDHAAKKLAGNPHFEVKGIAADGDSNAGSAASDARIAELTASNEALAAEVEKLTAALDERGKTLQEATARIAELEATVTSLQIPPVDEAPAKASKK
ncbi:hypothetical protein [Pandoraea apista]|uniref:hypothetical protein n=1 Tax=Pandoraea apista TaxID=93218 RepID=UPI000658C4F7|nr:hypothetical protein [Pandoraea apista]ALS63621.1 hypothetical protein AT395_00175 [Pandoraea apista]CFB63150.1 hypothetical protein LMG16407_03225 [Pandoraea apista]